MYKIGDLVRVVNDGYYFKKGEIYTIKEIYLSETIMLFDNWGVKSDNLEPVTHLTTKEFIKLVEDMGYGVLDGVDRIFIMNLHSNTIGYVYKYEVNAMDSSFLFKPKNDLFKSMTIYANTPLELREDKEQLYTLELPNNNKKHRYYQHMYEDKKHYTFGKLRKSDTWKCYFTQKEIENLDNQELIKVLVKREVK